MHLYMYNRGMLNKSKELNNMKKKKVTQKMINDAHRAWSILCDLHHECSQRDVYLNRSTELHNFTQRTISCIISDLESQSND